MVTLRWKLRPYDRERISTLSRAAGVSPLVAQLLINRGIDEPSAVAAFLDARLTGLHDPATLPGAAEAADRIVAAVRGGRKIVIYGDYDVDGVCGASILWACLRMAGAADVEYYIPHRVDEGYGVNAEALKRLVLERSASLIVTVDCGISAVAEAKLARELGVEFIVTDHHTIGAEVPEADAVVHPRLAGGAYPFGDLCGAGVAFKLAWQICKGFGDGKKASPHLRDFLVNAIGLVAMATVADMMPLCGENRLLVRSGLEGIAARPTVGLRALMEVSGCLDKKRLTTGIVGFNMAPRINASGRLDRAVMAVEMLTTPDSAHARELASRLDACNRQRQEVEQSIVAEAHQMIASEGGLGDRGAIVLGRPGWHPGVIGIVASRLVETYHRPSIVVAMADAICQGSARSVPGLNLYEAIQACSSGLIGFGGHAAAAGLRMLGSEFAPFSEQFDLHCRSMMTPELSQKVIDIDAEVPLGMLTIRVVEEIEALEPHGIGNPRPLLVANLVRVVGEPRQVGDRKNHLQFRVEQGGMIFKAIGWNLAEKARKLTENSVCSLAFHPSINEWKGKREVQLEVKAVEIGEAITSARPEPQPV